MGESRFGPWVSDAINRHYAALAARSSELAPEERLRHIEALVTRQVQWNDRECLVLNPATNTQNPAAAALLGSGIGSRPSLGYPGDKYETGLGPGEEFEVITTELARQVFRAAFAEIRVLSGAMANLAVFMATAQPGDVVFTLPAKAGGHATHQSFGAAGLYGLDVRPIPLVTDDATASWRVDLDALAAAARAVRPALITLGGSLALAPYPIREVRQIADAVGARVLFDAAHLSLLIAGEAFQQPLVEGAHVMTTSTYKALGGPPGGLILTDDPDLAERIDAVVYPGLTANNDLGRVAALAVCLNDLLVFSHEYAARCIETAQAFARALVAVDLPVIGHPPDYTQTHHLALDAQRWGNGTNAARRLEPANMLATGIDLPRPGIQRGLRLGSQELVRWGLGPNDMPNVADFIARVLVHREDSSTVRADVIDFRAGYQQVHYVVSPFASSA